MNILLLNGSPRKNGNSAALLQVAKKFGLANGHHITEISVYTGAFKPCVDCRSCKVADLECTIPDDMVKVYGAFEWADFIVLATPIYWFSVPGPLKNLFDRLRPYYRNEKLTGKKMIFSFVAGNGKYDSDLVTTMFERISKSLGIEFIGPILAKGYDENDLRASGDGLDEMSRLLEMYAC